MAAADNRNSIFEIPSTDRTLPDCTVEPGREKDCKYLDCVLFRFPQRRCRPHHRVMHSPDARLELAALYDTFGRTVYSMLLGMIRDPQTAEDLTQDTFLRVWIHRHRFDPERGRPEAWIMTVARHSAVDYLRALRPRVALDSIPPAAAEFHDLGDICAVRQALAALEPDQRLALELAYGEGLTHVELAERMQRPLGTVKTWVRMGLRNLAAQMG
jgi:RNA polymerase sigma-70 factor (ECF subfamily)